MYSGAPAPYTHSRSTAQQRLFSAGAILRPSSPAFTHFSLCSPASQHLNICSYNTRCYRYEYTLVHPPQPLSRGCWAPSRTMPLDPHLTLPSPPQCHACEPHARYRRSLEPSDYASISREGEDGHAGSWAGVYVVRIPHRKVISVRCSPSSLDPPLGFAIEAANPVLLTLTHGHSRLPTITSPVVLPSSHPKRHPMRAVRFYLPFDVRHNELQSSSREVAIAVHPLKILSTKSKTAGLGRDSEDGGDIVGGISTGAAVVAALVGTYTVTWCRLEGSVRQIMRWITMGHRELRDRG
ncbi:hypothetical protein BDW22DRAFT_1422999 [Trametopsis cervina]|nr:hypothetical protein BDW22DRAFT_1422999 [Trametopsis cervina]